MSREKMNLVGQTYGHWTVLKEAEPYVSPGGQKQRQWLCRCSCKKKTEKAVNHGSLRNGRSQCCGCGLERVDPKGLIRRRKNIECVKCHRIFKDTCAFPNKDINLCDFCSFGLELYRLSEEDQLPYVYPKGECSVSIVENRVLCYLFRGRITSIFEVYNALDMDNLEPLLLAVEGLLNQGLIDTGLTDLDHPDYPGYPAIRLKDAELKSNWMPECEYGEEFNKGGMQEFNACLDTYIAEHSIHPSF